MVLIALSKCLKVFIITQNKLPSKATLGSGRNIGKPNDFSLTLYMTDLHVLAKIIFRVIDCA